MQAILLAFLVSAATPAPIKLDASEVTRQETRYIEGLRTSFRSFEVDTSRFIRFVNGSYAKKSPEELKQMADTLHMLYRENQKLHALHPPVRVASEHERLLRGCDWIVQGAGSFYDLYRSENPKQQSLLQASQLFSGGIRQIKRANAAIYGVWDKPKKE